MKFRWNKYPEGISPKNLYGMAFAMVAVLTVSACEWDSFRRWMYDDSRIKPFERSEFFKDGASARPLVEGTVPRGHLDEDELFHTGKVDGKYTTVFPFKLTQEDLFRGKERFEIYCSVCHGLSGLGNGMVVQRGFKKPTSFHDKRLIDSPIGYFFDVASNGFATMPAYRTMISVRDRWLIVAYLRVLQRSQNARSQEVPEDKKADLNKTLDSAEEAS